MINYSNNTLLKPEDGHSYSYYGFKVGHLVQNWKEQSGAVSGSLNCRMHKPNLKLSTGLLRLIERTSSGQWFI